MSKQFWEAKYKNKQDGWDLGSAAPALKLYIDQLQDKNLKILIPGGGNSYEAEYLHNKGFTNVSVIEIARQPLKNIKKRVPTFPYDKLIEGDFFDLHDTFDLVIEQTFFCAINPSERQKYADKMAEIIKPGGKLVGILFNFDLIEIGPPYGGCASEYETYFTPFFDIQIMETNSFSVIKRAGRELFVKMVRK